MRGRDDRPRLVRQSLALPRCARPAGRARPCRRRPTPEERFATALEHARLTLELEGDTPKTVLEFRKHLGWYVRGLPGAAQLRERLHRVESLAEVERIFSGYLATGEVFAAA